jgi:hypothetical protein
LPSAVTDHILKGVEIIDRSRRRERQGLALPREVRIALSRGGIAQKPFERIASLCAL